MNIRDFQVGDRVRAIEDVAGYANLIGKTGIVVHVREDDMLGVEFDEKFPGGHSANGRGKKGFCRYGELSAFELETDISKIDIDISLESLFQ